MALETVNEVELGRIQLLLAFIPKAGQRLHRPRKVRVANENVRVSERAKTEVTKGPESEGRTLERNRLDTVVRQRFDHPPKIIEQRAVFLTCQILIDAKGISYFVGHHVGHDTIQGAPGQ